MNCEQSNIAFDKIENFFFSFFHVENAFQNRKKPKSIKLFSIFFFQKDSPIKPKKKTHFALRNVAKNNCSDDIKTITKVWGYVGFSQ